jgi:large subunit ribosomal protein L21
MYAIFRAGSRQYKVTEGESITIDRVQGKEGDTVKFDKILMVGGAKPVIGAPLIDGATVEAVIKAQSKAKKITVFKYKRRKNYKKTYGHKQPVTLLEIQKIKS